MRGEEEIAENPMIHRRWLFLPNKIEANPALLLIGLANISRWRKSDRLASFWALDIWKTMIEEAGKSDDGLDKLLCFLRADHDRSRQLKSCSPFPGILTTQELDQFTCASVL